MSTLICCARSATALNQLDQMLSVRLGEHELIEWSMDVETHPYFNPFFHIWGSTRVQATCAAVKFDATFQLDVQMSRVVSDPRWWMSPNQVGAKLTVNGEVCYAQWDPVNNFWTILRSIYGLDVGPEGFYIGMPIMFTGTDATNRWSHDRVVRKFWPPPNFRDMKPQLELEEAQA